MEDIRSSAHLRGPYHRLLVAWILHAMAKQGITQEAVASATDMHQTTVGGILNKHKGTFDLDEADAALRLLGSSLRQFMADPAHAVQPPAPPAVSKTSQRIVDVMSHLDESELKMVLVVAQTVRGAKKRSAPQRDAVRERKARKTGGTQ